MTRILIIVMFPLLILSFSQPSFSSDNFESFLAQKAKLIQKSSSKTVDPVLQEIQDIGGEIAAEFLQNWKDKKLYYIKSNGQFVLVEPAGKDDEGKKLTLVFDAISGKQLGKMLAKTLRQIKPNSGVRAKIASTLVPVQLASQNLKVRYEGVKTLIRDIRPSHLQPLQNAIQIESDQNLKQRMQQAYVFGVIAHDDDPNEVETAILSLRNNLSLEARAALNPLLKTKTDAGKNLPPDANVAWIITIGNSNANVNAKLTKGPPEIGPNRELTITDAYKILEEKGLVDKITSTKFRNEKLVEFAKNGQIGEIALTSLTTEKARNEAYEKLVLQNLVPPRIDQQQMQKTVSEYIFYSVYENPSKQITDAAKDVLKGINNKVSVFQLLDLVLDGLSLASIYFLAAIGLAITFGVMRVINMAHGEFIMMGAYTGYVTQLIVPSYTISIILAIPAAFCVTFLAGVLMERLVIRRLYRRPLETLLATFGVSIALQQIAKNIFGTQARPLTSPNWLDGAFVVNDVLAISNIRIAIFFLGLIFFGLMLYVMTRTRFGLETRAVTQNPMMAASMGIRTDRINMLTFGFGSGVAGIAGVAIGLFSKVTSELGSDYIVQSFMTVVVGGVGNIWGTLAGAAMIGSLQKLIEWFNPSNTLAAQTYMIIFIILFIQFRPKGLFALKGRAAEN